MKVRRLGQAVLVVGLTLAVVAAACADEHWIKLPTAPYTLNNKQDAIAFADTLTGWYGNGTGRIYRTDDGGEAWTAIWTKQGTYVRALEFADAQTVFLGNIGPGDFPGRDRPPAALRVPRQRRALDGGQAGRRPPDRRRLRH